MNRLTLPVICWLLTVTGLLLPVGDGVAQGFYSIPAPAGQQPVGTTSAPAPAAGNEAEPVNGFYSRRPVIPDSPGSSPATVLPSVAGASAYIEKAFAPSAGAEPLVGQGFAQADRVVIRKSKRRLSLMRSGRVIAEYPIRLGLNPKGHKQMEGDFRTPEGSYRLVRRNSRSRFFLSIEVSYPNGADRQKARRAGVAPGGLIMIHGQPNVPRLAADYYAANDWTDGCIAVSNPDMVEIWQRTALGTPIEIRP